MVKYALLFLMLIQQAYAQAPVNYTQCANRQKDVMDAIIKFHKNKSQELINRARSIEIEDEESREKQEILFRLAHKSFVKKLAMIKVSENFTQKQVMIDSLENFKSAYENSFKSKILLKGATDTFKSWARTMSLNSASFKSLNANIRKEIIDRVISSIAGDVVSHLSEDEIFILGLGTEIGMKATIDIGTRLVTAKAIGHISGATVLEWAGGPVGIGMLVAHLYMSGSHTYETRWIDAISEYPELMLSPQRMVELKLAPNSTRALYQHCLTWQRREISMKYLTKKLIAKIDEDIEIQISAVSKKYFCKREESLLLKARIDNLYVQKPKIPTFKNMSF